MSQPLPQNSPRLDTVREQAAFWLIERTSDEASAEKFAAWLAEDPLHQQVFEQIQCLWTAVDPVQEQVQKKAKRRRISGLAVLCFLAVMLQQQLPWQYWGADYHSETGQIRTITLEDGSTATLNSRSAINVYYAQGQRRIDLVQGEVLVDVRHDNQQRSFIVSTPLANAEALGTRYSVEKSDKQTQVRVYESIVRIRNRDSDDEVLLHAAQQAIISQIGIQQTELKLPPTPDWSNHRLRFNQQPLSAVIKRLAKYHPGIVMLLNKDEQSERQFTGVLPTDDTGAAIQLLADTMGLTVYSLSPYLVLLDSGKKK